MVELDFFMKRLQPEEMIRS